MVKKNIWWVTALKSVPNPPYNSYDSFTIVTIDKFLQTNADFMRQSISLFFNKGNCLPIHQSIHIISEAINLRDCSRQGGIILSGMFFQRCMSSINAITPPLPVNGESEMECGRWRESDIDRCGCASAFCRYSRENRTWIDSWNARSHTA